MYNSPVFYKLWIHCYYTDRKIRCPIFRDKECKKPVGKEKACNTCKEAKDLSEFHNDKNRPDGHVGCCIPCSNVKKLAREARKAEEANNPKPEDPKPTETKTCSGCGECKTVDNFHKDANKDDGFHTRCKKCREKEKKPKAKKPVVTEKPCKKCGEIKKIEDFPERKEAADGHRNECNKCRSKLYAPKKQERDPEKEYTCNTCKEVKLGSEFYDTASKMCAVCEGKRMHEYRKTLDGALKELVGSAKSNSKSKKGEASKFEIDFEFVKGLYEQQGGRCYYSGIEMTTSGQFKMSLERLDNNKGYIKDNLVLVCLEFNNQMHWSREKVSEIITILDQNITENFIDLYTTPYDKSPAKKLSDLSCSANSRAKAKSNEKRTMEYEMSASFIKELYNKQKGLCAYSGLPLRFGKREETNWLISLERIDVHRGYTKDNVCLICLEFNSTDRTVNKTYKSETSTGWSKAKFEFFLNTVRARTVKA